MMKTDKELTKVINYIIRSWPSDLDSKLSAFYVEKCELHVENGYSYVRIQSCCAQSFETFG